MCVHPGYIFMQGACDAHVSTLATYESTSVLVLMISGQATLPTCVAPILGRGSCKLCLYFTTQVHSSHLYFITITTHAQLIYHDYHYTVLVPSTSHKAPPPLPPTPPYRAAPV